MTLRALLLGLGLALLICGFTYYNNQILRQTYFVGNHLPIGVFGVLLLLLFLANPVLNRVKQGLALRASEFAIMAALGLSVCCWPFVNGFRQFTTGVTAPNHLYKVEAGWQGARIMSYVPGGSPLLAPGFVKDWRAVQQRTKLALKGPKPSLLQLAVARLPEEAQRRLSFAVRSDLQADDRRALLDGLNAIIEGPPLLARARKFQLVDDRTRSLAQKAKEAQAKLAHATSQKQAAPAGNPQRLAQLALESRALALKHWEGHLNRSILELAFEGALVRAPPGDSVLVAHGADDPFAVGTLVTGWQGPEPLGLGELPWSTWWPTLKLWGGVSILVVFCMFCMALIVHPQWTKRELLPYPIVAFLRDVVASDERGKPAMLSSRLFFLGFASVLFLNLVNATHAWFPAFPEIPKQMDFTPVKALFPEVSKVGWTTELIFLFTVYPIVVAFTYFIRSDVGLSLGISNIFWAIFGVALVSNGVVLQHGDHGWNAAELIRMGAGFGFAGFILYAGRRYFSRLLIAAFAFRAQPETPGYAVWAARGMLLSFLGAVLLLQQLAGLHWIFGSMVVGTILVIALVMARVNAEGGVFYFSPGWSPLHIVPAFLGLQALSPTQYLTTSLVRWQLLSDPRGIAMPFFLNGLHASESVGKTKPPKIAPLMGALIVMGFLVSLAVTLWFQYSFSANPADEWGREKKPKIPFDAAVRQIAHLSSRDELSQAVSGSVWERLATAAPDSSMLSFLAVGLLGAALFAFARSRYNWWPLHPILLVSMSTFETGVIAPSILIGWVIRSVIVKVGGAEAYRMIKPLMIGVIAGELLSAIAWTLVALVYYLATGLTPPSFEIFIS